MYSKVVPWGDAQQDWVWNPTKLCLAGYQVPQDFVLRDIRCAEQASVTKCTQLFCGAWYPSGLSSVGSDTLEDFVLRGVWYPSTPVQNSHGPLLLMGCLHLASWPHESFSRPVCLVRCGAAECTLSPRVPAQYGPTPELEFLNKMPKPGILESRDLRWGGIQGIVFTQLFF